MLIVEDLNVTEMENNNNSAVPLLDVVQLKSTKFHIYCSSYPIFVITQLVHTL